MQDWPAVAANIDEIHREFRDFAKHAFGLNLVFFRFTDKLGPGNKKEWDIMQKNNAEDVDRLKRAFQNRLLWDRTYQHIKTMRNQQLEFTVSDHDFLTSTLMGLNLYVRELVNNRKKIARYDDRLIRQVKRCVMCNEKMTFTQNHIIRIEELIRCVLLNDKLFRLVRGYYHVVLADIIENPNGHEDYAASTAAFLKTLRAAAATNILAHKTQSLHI
jgi:hypothetical protein